MKKVELNDIAKDIASYIENKVSNITYDDQKWKEHYDSVVEELKNEIERTKEVIKDYSEDNLTVNRIELEGYLRGLITMTNQFERWLP